MVAMKQTMQFTLLNRTDSVAEIWVSHRSEGTDMIFALIQPPNPDGVDRYSYPVSTAYHAASVGSGTGSLKFALEYDDDSSAHDYWFVAVNLSGGSRPGAFSYGGSTLNPTAEYKVSAAGKLTVALDVQEVYDVPLLTHLNDAALGTSFGPFMAKDQRFNPYPAKRKSVKALTDAERKAYVNAVLALKKSPSRMTPPTRSRYDDYVLVHILTMRPVSVTDPKKPVDNTNITIGDMRTDLWAHQSPAFVPWHREFLRQFELDLQLVAKDNSIAIPYWDWTVNSAKDGPPWTQDFMGGDGHDGPVADQSPFAGRDRWQITLSTNKADQLVRGFGLRPGFGRLPVSAEVTLTLGENAYDATPWNTVPTATFRNRVEGYNMEGFASPATDSGMHNLVHNWVGGNSGTMLWSSSPNDPVFFLHHANIDRLWGAWQKRMIGISAASPLYAPPTELPGRSGQSLKEKMIFTDANVFSEPWPDPPTPEQVRFRYDMNYMYDTDDDGVSRSGYAS